MAESPFTAPAHRLRRTFRGLLIAALFARDQRAPETHRAGDQPEPHRQNFAVGEIPFVVALPWFGQLGVASGLGFKV